MENAAIQIRSRPKNNYRFGFRDRRSGGLYCFKPRLVSRRSETTPFLQGSSEEQWKPLNHRVVKDGDELTLELYSRNVDWELCRRITLRGDEPYLRLRYTLTALEDREQANYSFFMLRLAKDLTALSYDRDGGFVTVIGAPAAADTLNSHLFLFHDAKAARTLLVAPDLNAPRTAGYADGGNVRIGKSGVVDEREPSVSAAIPYFKTGDR